MRARLQRKGLATRQSQAYLPSAGGPSLMYPLDVHMPLAGGVATLEG